MYAPVAQLDRAPDYESEGRPFESGRAHLILKDLPVLPFPKNPNCTYSCTYDGDLFGRKITVKPLPAIFDKNPHHHQKQQIADITPILIGTNTRRPDH